MLRVLRNPVRQHINGWFRGRDIRFKSKSTRIFDLDDEEQEAEYRYWLEIYGFIYDDTANVLIGGEDK